MGGGGGGGDNAAAVQQEQEESRKSALRARVNALFGSGDADPVYEEYDETVPGGPSPVGPAGPLIIQRSPLSTQRSRRLVDSGLSGDSARNQFASEEDALSANLRGYYGDEQKRAYEEAEHQMRFGAANTGNIGSTTYADAQANLAEKNRMGATRVDEAVQRAITGLRSSRENSRLNAIQLVNSGSGEDAVNSASSGLRQALDAAKAGNREDLFSNLFTNLAFTKSAGDAASRDEKIAQLFAPKPGGNAYYTTPASAGTLYK